MDTQVAKYRTDGEGPKRKVLTVGTYRLGRPLGVTSALALAAGRHFGSLLS